MDMSEGNKLHNAQIEALLQTEIAWALSTQGPGWDPTLGAFVEYQTKRWECGVDHCGTCAIGALLIHHQPPTPDIEDHYYDEDCKAAAILLRKPVAWVEALYYAVGCEPFERVDHEPQDAVEMGYRLRDYGDDLALALKFSR